MTNRSPGSDNPVALTRKSMLPNPPQSAIFDLINASGNMGNWGEKIRKLHAVGGETDEAIIDSRGERSRPL